MRDRSSAALRATLCHLKKRQPAHAFLGCRLLCAGLRLLVDGCVRDWKHASADVAPSSSLVGAALILLSPATANDVFYRLYTRMLSIV